MQTSAHACSASRRSFRSARCRCVAKIRCLEADRPHCAHARGVWRPVASCSATQPGRMMSARRSCRHRLRRDAAAYRLLSSLQGRGEQDTRRQHDDDRGEHRACIRLPAQWRTGDDSRTTLACETAQHRHGGKRQNRAASDGEQPCASAGVAPSCSACGAGTRLHCRRRSPGCQSGSSRSAGTGAITMDNSRPPSEPPCGRVRLQARRTGFSRLRHAGNTGRRRAARIFAGSVGRS